MKHWSFLREQIYVLAILIYGAGKKSAIRSTNLWGIVSEGKEGIHRCCRLLVGMQKLPIDIVRDHFNHENII